MIVSGQDLLKGIEGVRFRSRYVGLGQHVSVCVVGAGSHAMILQVSLASDGKFLGGKIHAGKQAGRGGPVLDETGEAIRKIRSLSQIDFGASAPKIADDGMILNK